MLKRLKNEITVVGQYKTWSVVIDLQSPTDQSDLFRFAKT